MNKYTVKEGEDLGTIARKFGLVSWKYLYEINKEEIGDNPDLLKAGTRLEIPQWDTTSGDEKIEEKGASAFAYTGGMRYRYPWVAFSVSLTDSEGENTLEEIPEDCQCVIQNRSTKETFCEMSISQADEVAALIPDTTDVNIGVKGTPLKINGVLHIHPDDSPWST